MLIAFSIRDFVLVDALDLDVCRGFTSITGETGAGKSVLLDALRFVLGGKAEKRFIRMGAERACVSTSFYLDEDHPARSELVERGLLNTEDDILTLRRVLTIDGPTRMFANDQIISAELARSLSDSLVEIHGQHDGTALLNPRLHGDILDQFSQAAPFIARVGEAFERLSARRDELNELKGKAKSLDAEMQQLQHILEDLDKLAPGEGEASRLTLERAMLMNSQKLIECLTEADEAMAGSGAANSFGAAARHIERALRLPELAEAPEDSPQLAVLQSSQDAIERVLIELNEATIAVETARSTFEHDPEALEQVENRLFALKTAARKFNVEPDGLPELHQASRQRLSELESYDDVIAETASRLREAEVSYSEAADKLTALRTSSGEQLAKAVQEELGPLKLEHARFRVHLEQLDLEDAGPNGQDKIVFEVQTNPGAPFGALNQIASGGELARFTLALRVCLANLHSASLLVFDEADQGVGGAVAAAVGERLSRLADARQVMAITHSPQVAASGHQHWHVTKKLEDGVRAVSQLNHLEGVRRQEEIARMISGNEITNEARAAADRLMEVAV